METNKVVKQESKLYGKVLKVQIRVNNTVYKLPKNSSKLMLRN